MNILGTLLFTAALAVALPPVPSHDDIINLPWVSKLGPIIVTTIVDEDNDDGDCSLREAIKAVNTESFVDACGSGLGNHEIYVPPGEYVLTIVEPGTSDGIQESSLQILTSMSIKGGGRDSTIVDIQSRSRIFYIKTEAEALLASLTVCNGRAPDAPEQTDVEDGVCTMVGEDGGAIYNDGGLTLKDVALRNSHAGNGSSQLIDPDCMNGDGIGGRGGAIYTTGTLDLTGTLFEGNASGAGGLGDGGDGGAIYAEAGAEVHASACIFSMNMTMPGGSYLEVPFYVGYSSGSGGAVANTGSFEATSSSFTGNKTAAGTDAPGGSHSFGGSGGAGGALHNGAAATARITASTFAHNETGGGGDSSTAGNGGQGAAIANAGEIEITNSTISGNTTGNGGNGSFWRAGDGGSGGGVWNDGVLHISATTVTANRTGSGGSQPFGDPGSDGQGGGVSTTVSFLSRGLILASNVATTGPDCAGTLDSRGYNLLTTIVGCTITGNKTGNITGYSAKLGPLADNGGGTLTQMPHADSPVLNAAICQTVDDLPLLFDQRWVHRPQGPTCDIGAVER